MTEIHCPRCRADQRPRWSGMPDPDLEGRDWYCSECNAYLMVLNGRVSVVKVPPPMKDRSFSDGSGP